LLIILKKKKKNYFFKNFYFLLKSTFKLTNNITLKLKKFKLINFIIFKYYNNYFNFLNNIMINKKESNKDILILLNFKNSQPFFSIIDLKKKNTKITFSLFTILKLLKITNKSLKKTNKSLSVIFNFLKKNIFKKLNPNNIIFIFKMIQTSQEIIFNFLKLTNFLKLKYLIISKKTDYSLRKRKKIRSIKRRLRKKMLKNSQNNY